MVARRAQEKLLKAYGKNPYRSMPDPTPATSTLTTAEPTPGAKPTPAAQAQPTKWMMMPTMEEFGVRRPFNAMGHPRPGGSEWPMMSRAMTHVRKCLHWLPGFLGSVAGFRA